MSNQGLKCCQRLECCLEADGSWRDLMRERRLCDDGADEVIGKDVCPDLFANELRCFAAQDVHLQCDCY